MISKMISRRTRNMQAVAMRQKKRMYHGVEMALEDQSCNFAVSLEAKDELWSSEAAEYHQSISIQKQR